MSALPDKSAPHSPQETQVSVGANEAIRRDLSTYQSVQNLLAQDPSLLYLDETYELYHVRHSTDLDLLVRKNRSLPEPFPATRPVLLQKAYSWLWMACLGLLLAGLGAMMLAMMAAAAALGLNLQPISRADRIRSLVVLLISGALWLSGLLFLAILIVHLI